MSVKNGVWHDVKSDPPQDPDEPLEVLMVKGLKNGSRVICFGRYMGHGQWVTNNGNGAPLYWCPLPPIPED